MTGRVLAVLAALAVSQAQMFRSGVDLVQVDVAVMRGGAPVAGLTAANFVLTDNGEVQDVTSARLDQLPLNVILTLDVSGSVAGEKLAHLIDAGQMLVASLHPKDRAALVTFSSMVRVPVPLTGDFAAVGTALSTLEGRDATSMYDAVQAALQLRPLDDTRTVLLVFTDGADNLSWLTATSVIDEARRAGLVIHIVKLQGEAEPLLVNGAVTTVSPGSRSQHAVPVTQALAEASGGRVWSATSSADLRKLFGEAIDEMRARYLLTFTPTNTRPGWHELKVKLKGARGDVTARPGYAVPTKGH
jgi:VWFA-related protein